MDNKYQIFDASALEELYQQYCYQVQQQQSNTCHCELSSTFDLKCNMNHDFGFTSAGKRDFLIDLDNFSDTTVDEKKSVDYNKDTQDKEIEKQEIEKWKQLIQTYNEEIKKSDQFQNT